MEVYAATLRSRLQMGRRACVLVELGPRFHPLLGCAVGAANTVEQPCLHSAQCALARGLIVRAHLG